MEDQVMETIPAYLNIPPEDLSKYSKIPFQIISDLDALYTKFARTIADEIQSNNDAGKPTRLILPVGPIGQFPILAQICNQENISWKNVFTFNMDEYCDWQGRVISPEHPLSFRGHIQKELFDKLDPEIRIPTDQIHFPDPLNLDDISQKIQEVGGIDTCYGGIGYHGHVAFNEPPISRWYKLTPEEFRRSLTRVLHLAPETIVMNSIRATGGNPAMLPPMAVTLGMNDIYNAKRIRLYCQGGSWQRTVLRIALMGDEDVDYPVTLLQDHPDIKIYATLDTSKAPIPETQA
jgi:glucosamine-6-phosphate deaminase